MVSKNSKSRKKESLKNKKTKTIKQKPIHKKEKPLTKKPSRKLSKKQIKLGKKLSKIHKDKKLKKDHKTQIKKIISHPNKHKKSRKKPSKKGFLSKLTHLFSKKKPAKLNETIKKDINPTKNNKEVPKPKYIQTGIKGFDELFLRKNAGIPRGASVLVEGGPGSGKTLFCLTTLNNLCKQGKKGLYMSFEEPEERLIGHMESFGWAPKEYIKKGLLRITRFNAIDVSRSIEALLSAAKKELLIEVNPVFFPTDFEPDFIVIDSLTSIASAFSGEESRFRIYMEQLFRYLEKNQITNFLIREVSSPSHIGTTFKEQGDAVSFLSDGIIVIYNVIYDSGERSAAMEILKMRGTPFKKRIVELTITDGKGLEINSNKIIKKDKKNNFNLT
ncbi:hypothetical protein HOE04_01135 [archaeon]|jgi:KaiC/GvpD/RAD55 family RecA-like ATPase|nr:hypothetical protein [archaeon]